MTIDTPEFRELLQEYYQAKVNGMGNTIVHCKEKLITHINAKIEEAVKEAQQAQKGTCKPYEPGVRGQYGF